MLCKRDAVGLIVLICVLFAMEAIGAGLQGGIPQPASELLSLGSPGPKKIGLQVWGGADSPSDLREGDRLAFTVQAEEDGYLTIVGFSADGTATILFPNPRQPDNAVKGGAVSVVFGEDSPVQIELGRRAPGSWIAFYVNSKSFGSHWAKMGEPGQWIRVTPSSEKARGMLKDALIEMAKDERFNKLIFPVETAPGQGFEFKPLESSPTDSRKPLKRLPGALETKRPGTTTGTQGIREQVGED